MAEETKQRYPITIWVKAFILCLLFVGWVILMLLLYFQSEDRAAQAFLDGRYVKILVETGDIEGSMLVTSDKAASIDDYRKRRIEELTGKKASEVVPDRTASADSTATQDPSASTQTDSDSGSIVKAETAKISPLSVVTRKIDTPLPPAPNANLVETLESGETLPKISDDGETLPWSYYSKNYTPIADTRLLSIVITNLGLNVPLTQKVLELDERLTLGFSPYAQDVPRQISVARTSGFEAWLMLPLQHETYPIHDYGPLTLLAEESVEENINQVLRIVSGAHGVVGLLALPDEHFSRTPQMTPVYDAITQRGLLLTLYEKSFAPTEQSHMLLRARPHIHGGNMPSNLEQLFREIESYVQTGGHTVITMSALPNVMAQLNDWIITLPARNIQLVPLSAHAHKKSL